MLDRVAVGELAAKPHTALRDAEGALRYEECLTRAGFDGPYSILYHRARPHAWVAASTEQAALAQTDEVEQSARAAVALVDGSALRRRHYRTSGVPAGGSLLGARVPLLENADVLLSVARPLVSSDKYFVNADADELWFVREGRGVVRSVFGDLAFGPDDYVCIPKGVLHRVELAEPVSLLLIECRGGVGLLPQARNAVGQLRMDAPYSHRDFRRPSFVGPVDEGIREVVVQRFGRQHVYRTLDTPLDVVGWDGTVYPWAFPILAFQPRVSSVHLPPTWHGTFAARNTLICSFVPRPLDFHPDAIPCPYPHASVDVDEVLYYVRGQFGSRTGVEAGSLTLHPRGVPHGPHPGRYEASLGATRTEELAVMLDCYTPLVPCARAHTLEDARYDASFSGG
ncbi:MAG: homogentisate 1,2-dioxygenase [Polyangiales bacterium]